MIDQVQGFADLDAYFAHYGRGPDVPTPVVDRSTGRVYKLGSLLHAPRRESVFARVRRMADLITRRVSAAGNVTREELLGGGFSADEITTLFPLALRRSGVVHLGTHL